MDKIKHSPIISYRLDVENNSKLLVTPSKLIPFLTIVGLFLIAKIYLKLYSFCSNPSTTLNTRINPIIWYILAAKIINLVGVLLMSLVVVLAYQEMADEKILRIVSIILVELSSFYLFVLTRNVVRFYPHV
jgi:hypothetical protein